MLNKQNSAGGFSLQRRDLSISIVKVDLRLYRRTRTSCDIARVPPHFLYQLRLEWSGDTLPRSSPAGSPRGSPNGSPRGESPGSPRKKGSGEGPFEEPESWWDSLPRSYTVKRRWHEIVRFHEVIIGQLALDPNNRVKARIPILPGKADLDSWTSSYAATGDACALSRRLKLDPPTQVAPQGLLALHADAPMDDLEALHWRYVELRLTPYFEQVNKVLREIPTKQLAACVALNRFVVPGSRGAMTLAPYSTNGIRRRFLGVHQPCTASPEDIESAVKLLRRTQPAGWDKSFRSSSAPTLSPSAEAAKQRLARIGSPSAAAAKLVVAGGSSGSNPQTPVKQKK